MTNWKNIRAGAGLTQEQMAEKLGVTRVSVTNYEKGNRRMPDWVQIEYLKLRNNEEDKKIIDYLKERI